jgi:phospholipase/lecithinase/hemolysin
MKTPRYVVLVALLITFALAANAQAQSITQVVVLGDSLSDNGNLYNLIGLPGAPYWQGRISNGPVAVEHLAQSLGVPLKDFAVAGATTGVGNVVDGGTVDTLGFISLPGITTAFEGALSGGLFPVDSNALYIVWGGANDLLYFATTPAAAAVAIEKAVTNLVIIVGALQSLGATHIAVINLPDLGKSPFILANGPQVSAFFTQISIAFNQTLQSSLPLGVHYVDGFSIISNMQSNAEVYGFENSTEPCFTGSSLCTDPDKYVYFDSLHPTTAAHKLIGNGFYQSVAPTVIIGECDSGVPNEVLITGRTYSDLIMQAGNGAENHDEFVSAVAFITNELKKSGAISGSQKGAIQKCGAQADIP